MDNPRHDPEPLAIDISQDCSLIPTKYVDIVPNGDAMLLVKASPGTQEVFGLRVSLHTLSLASPFFAAEFALTRGATDAGWTGDVQHPWADVTREGNSYTWLLCMYIMHFRHDLLPPALEASILATIARTAHRYSFVAAIGWSTSNWFDYIYNDDNDCDVDFAIEAAMLLDQPTYFSRFTSRMVLYHDLRKDALQSRNPLWQSAVLMDKIMKQRILAFDLIRQDLDFLLEPLAIALSSTGRHWIDYAPGVQPEPDEFDQGFPPEHCTFDTNAAVEYLSSLSNATIWPSFSWPDFPGDVVDMIRDWQMPAIEQGDECNFCLPLSKSLERQLAVVRTLQAKRLWGLCLGCLYSEQRTQACRVDHGKQSV